MTQLTRIVYEVDFDWGTLQTISDISDRLLVMEKKLVPGLNRIINWIDRTDGFVRVEHAQNSVGFDDLAKKNISADQQVPVVAVGGLRENVESDKRVLNDNDHGEDDETDKSLFFHSYSSFE